MNLRSLLRLANLLTFLRFLLILPFTFYFRAKSTMLASIFFGAAALTDTLDGRIARKYGTTNFGAFMDSFVDKLLVGAALICLTLFKDEALGFEGGLIPMWMVLVILVREVVVTVLRTVFVIKNGKVVAANRWGKYKTASQFIVILISLVLLALFPTDSDRVIRHHGPIYFMMYLPLVLTVVSGSEFVFRNREAVFNLVQPSKS